VRLLTTPAEPKRLGLLRELVPQATTIGVLLNPARSGSASQLSDVQEAVRMLNLQVHILQASTDREVESAFEAVAAQGIHALAVAGDPFFDTRREKLVALAARHAVQHRAPTDLALNRRRSKFRANMVSSRSS
jgi:putative ABC transport system substrate-binding protein